MLIFQSFTNPFYEISMHPAFMQTIGEGREMSQEFGEKIKLFFEYHYERVLKEEKPICDYHYYKTAV